MAVFMVLNLIFWTWTQAEAMSREGFSWLRVACVVLAAFGAGIWVTRFRLVRRFLDGAPRAGHVSANEAPQRYP
ncbi:hypothetical protein EAH86_16955 [Pedococcus bigeumensis]|uniref:Uncharacterized protein n=1 Tax=Pedococcus bigeumensis TaxID=433644 RepID=A0A502CL15_9MICO|nr:hypothetical protein EAH86_16955 [Pedococcus bigeumensis]